MEGILYAYSRGMRRNSFVGEIDNTYIKSEKDKRKTFCLFFTKKIRRRGIMIKIPGRFIIHVMIFFIMNVMIV
jgi:hypothetical protein